MDTGKILYTDGHEVTVTDSFFKVKKSFYQLKGITDHGFYIIHPGRVVPSIIIMMGGLLISLGAFRLIPENVIQNVRIYSVELGMNESVISVGTVLLIAGALILALMKDRYAIRIATAEGEKNVVVSKRREYINQIQDALNHALLNLISPGRSLPSSGRSQPEKLDTRVRHFEVEE